MLRVKKFHTRNKCKDENGGGVVVTVFAASEPRQPPCIHYCENIISTKKSVVSGKSDSCGPKQT
jgi:hypothetical protein